MSRMIATIAFDVPSSVSRSELREYLKDAIESWGGQRHPYDHLFNTIKNTTVKFTPLPKKQKA